MFWRQYRFGNPCRQLSAVVDLRDIIAWGCMVYGLCGGVWAVWAAWRCRVSGTKSLDCMAVCGAVLLCTFVQNQLAYSHTET